MHKECFLKIISLLFLLGLTIFISSCEDSISKKNDFKFDTIKSSLGLAKGSEKRINISIYRGNGVEKISSVDIIYKESGHSSTIRTKAVDDSVASQNQIFNVNYLNKNESCNYDYPVIHISQLVAYCMGMDQEFVGLQYQLMGREFIFGGEELKKEEEAA